MGNDQMAVHPFCVLLMKPFEVSQALGVQIYLDSLIHRSTPAPLQATVCQKPGDNDANFVIEPL